MAKKYNIGLDIGNTSVGWAVVGSDDFKVLQKKGQALWGVRLFNEAHTAESRRLARSTRRRYDRRRKRIELLQKEFEQEINKVDSDFYTKLKESFYKQDDSIHKTILLSLEDREKIIRYHKKYPTIYHLRKRLIEDQSKCDIRFVYLAIHHIVKYRGNFLYDGSNFKVDELLSSTQIENLFSLMQSMDCFQLTEESLLRFDYEYISNTLLEASKTDKKVKLEKEFGKELPPKITKELVKALLGDTVLLNTLFEKEIDEDIKISFKGSNYEDQYDKIVKYFEEELEILDELKRIYDGVYLTLLFDGSENPSLSSLMVKRYKTQGEDLKKLKKIYRVNDQLFKKMFKTSKDGQKLCEYDLYLHNKKTYDEFTKQIQKDVQSFDHLLDTSLLQLYEEQILKNIQQENFLPRITSVDNGKYPYQLNKDELIKILENQGKYYPFLLDKTKDGVYKIVSLLEFRIPYYVGPLNNTTTNRKEKNKNSWMVRLKDQVRITPYNFKEVVNLEASAEEFIERMIGKCTYLLEEKSMPSSSILYSKFKVLNELKQIKIGEKGQEVRLSKEEVLDIYENLFLKQGGVITDRKFQNYLKKTGRYDMFEELSVTGYSSDNKFANHMQSYIDFFGPNGFFTGTNYTLDNADEIIRLVTIFEDKSILKKRLQKEYPDLSDSVLNQICSKRYTGWSNLSKKLLTEICYEDSKTSTSKNIMTLLEETSENFMQILFNKEYCLQDKIDQYNKIDANQKIHYGLVEDLATSPATKRGIYQALKVVEEIIEYMGYEPDKIILEMARGREEKRRKDDRKKRLEKLYEKSKKEIDQYNKLSKQLKSFEKIDGDKLFLYFVQEGKSLYSGKPLDIENLNQYEIDHIIPRTLIKDDSLENKALVLREENQLKADSFVVPEEFRTISRKSWWLHLKKMGLISAKKYNNLCRYKYDERLIEGFIDRQLVETRQIIKHVANIIKNYHKNTKVLNVSSKLGHNYRDRFDLFKFRDINDYHHAHDAYLVAVLGEYKETLLNSCVDFDVLRKVNRQLFEEGKYKQAYAGYVINSFDPQVNMYFRNYDEDGVVSFDIEQFNRIVENTLYRNDILISRKTEKATGEFYDQTIYSFNSPKNKNGIPIKDGLEGYGCYSSMAISYLCLVEYKGKRKLVGIPILIDQKSKLNPSIKMNYIREHLKTEQFEILKDPIYLNTELIYKDQLVSIQGYASSKQTCELGNVTELKIPRENMRKWRYVLNWALNDQKIEMDDCSIEKVIDEIVYWLLEKKKFYPLYQNVIIKIQEYYSKNLLSLLEKKKFLIQLFRLYGTGKLACKFSDFPESNIRDRAERLNGINVSSGTLIYKSVTGIWEKKDEF